jgi:hypothetical protein
MAFSRALALCILVPILLAGVVSWQRSDSTVLDDVFSDGSNSPALELLQRGAKVVHVAKSQDQAKTTKTTTASATGVGANGVGNLPTFITGMCTDVCVIALCIYLFCSFSQRYPILFGKGAMSTTNGGKEPAQVDDSVIKKANENGDHIVKKRNPEEDDMKWQPANRSWLGFAYVSWSLDYDAIQKAAGLDKAMLIMFLDKCCRAFKYIAIPMFWITGPLNCFFGGNAAGEDHESWFSLGNVQFYSWLYWITGFATCYVAYIVCNMICIDGMLDFQKYRKKWLLEMDERRSKTLMMTGIPEAYQNEAKCKAFWNQLTYDKVDSVYITKDVDLYLPAAEAEKLKSGNKSLTLQKAIALRDAKKIELSAAENDNDYVKKAACETELANLASDIALFRTWTEKMAAETTGDKDKDGNYLAETGAINLSTGFITFKDRVTTESALTMNLGNHTAAWVMDKAPEPVDIIWSDFTEDPTAGGGRALLGYALTAGMMCIYMPLVVAIANVAEAINLGPLQMFWSSEAPSIGLTIMVDFLPTLLVLIFTNCFSVYDKSGQQYKLTVWYFWMNMLFVVLVTAVGTSFMSFVKTLANDPLKIFHLLATTMPNCTHYYMNYLGMQWYSMAMQLTRYMGVIKYRVFIRHHPEEEARNLAEPEDQDYYGIGSRTARFSTLVTIGIVYGTLSPPCSVLAWLTVLWMRTLFGYQFVFNETRKPDLGGAFFARALHNMYVALHIYFILMCGVLYIRGNDCGPAIVAFCGWVYVFFSQAKFSKLKWEYVEIDHLFDEKYTKGTKPRALHGQYKQPEMYDEDGFAIKVDSDAAKVAGKVQDLQGKVPGAGMFNFGSR